MDLLVSDPRVWLLALWFGLAICVVDLYDISLPRGDSFGVSGALVAAGVVIFSSMAVVPIAVSALSGLMVAHFAKPLASTERSILAALCIRATSVVVAALAVGAVGDSGNADSLLIVEGILAASLYLGVELLGSQAWLALTSRRDLVRLVVGNIRRQTPIIAAQVSVSALLVVTFPTMQAWALLPVTAMLLLIRQSYELLLQMRETYRTTVGVLVQAAEGQDGRLEGHGDRTAQIARSICARLGMTAHHVERASYAALLHNLGAIAEDFDEHEPRSSGNPPASQVVEDVAFLRDVASVMRVCDGVESGQPKEDDMLVAMAVGLACEIDVLRNAGVATAHTGSTLRRVASLVPAPVKAKVVAAALQLGYEIPAVN